jgi:large subunit ribosomal protein L29
MKTDKVRNFTDEELRHQEHELNDQLFKLKFQLNMGQTESLKKIRGLRKDIARVKTIGRERELATGTSGGIATIVAPKAVAGKAVATKAKRKTEKK